MGITSPCARISAANDAGGFPCEIAIALSGHIQFPCEMELSRFGKRNIEIAGASVNTIIRGASEEFILMSERQKHCNHLFDRKRFSEIIKTTLAPAMRSPCSVDRTNGSAAASAAKPFLTRRNAGNASFSGGVLNLARGTPRRWDERVRYPLKEADDGQGVPVYGSRGRWSFGLVDRSD